MTFLPDNYSPPQPIRNYLKFMKGDTAFRILSPAILGWEYWVTEKDGKRRPVRVPMDGGLPADTPEPPRHFWAMFVYDFLEMRVMVLEITQKSIQKAIKALADDPSWGNPTQFDIVVTKTGDGLETEYNVKPRPPKPAEKEVLEAWNEIRDSVDLTALFRNEDPFKAKADAEDQIRKDLGIA